MQVQPGSSLPRDPAPAPEQATNSSSSILFLDDDPARAAAFLTRQPEAVWVENALDCIARLGDGWHQVHLDHDLGGEIFVDSKRPDCGMEVVRWLCAEAREQLEKTLFIIHTHNAEAAETMVRTLREHHYLAVYRPFGIDLFDWLPDEESDDGRESTPESSPRSPWKEWLGRLSRRLRPAQAHAHCQAAGEPTSTDKPSTRNKCGSDQNDDRAQDP
jgi:hypothetical protein